MELHKPSMTREDQAVMEWIDLASSARTRLAAESPQVPSLVAGFDLLSYAVANLGECELHARSLERSIAIEVFSDRRTWLAEKVERLNDGGVGYLAQFRKLLPAIKKEVGKEKFGKKLVVDAMDLARETFREKIGEWEMKGSDAKKLMDVVTEMTGIVVKGGASGLLSHVEKHIELLISVRREPDRGARENIPWWKILTIVCMFAIFLLGSLLAAVTRGATQEIIALVQIALLIGGMIALILFC